MNESQHYASTQPLGRSARKHNAILDGATELFLSKGYNNTSMDDIAALSQVSKQTVYKHFSNKESLFVEIVERMAVTTGDRVIESVGENEGGGAGERLYAYALRQLREVLTPRLLQLRRVVIGEATRFPELARAFYENGPQRAIDTIAGLLRDLHAQGDLRVDDPDRAATQFNWLLMGGPLNRAMFLGDNAIPTDTEKQNMARRAVEVMISTYGM